MIYLKKLCIEMNVLDIYIEPKQNIVPWKGKKKIEVVKIWVKR